MLMLSPFANADMDNICSIVLDKTIDLLGDAGKMAEMIESKGCERNNILLLTLPSASDNTFNYQTASAFWCRHDRNESVVDNRLKCVLYDTKPRKFLN